MQRCNGVGQLSSGSCRRLLPARCCCGSIPAVVWLQCCMPHGKPAAAESGSTLSHRSREARRWAAESCEWRLTGSVCLPEAPHASYVNSYFVVHACMLVCVPRRSVPVSTQPSAAKLSAGPSATTGPSTCFSTWCWLRSQCLCRHCCCRHCLCMRCLPVCLSWSLVSCYFARSC